MVPAGVGVQRAGHGGINDLVRARRAGGPCQPMEDGMMAVVAAAAGGSRIREKAACARWGGGSRIRTKPACARWRIRYSAVMRAITLSVHAPATHRRSAVPLMVSKGD